MTKGMHILVMFIIGLAIFDVNAGGPGPFPYNILGEVKYADGLPADGANVTVTNLNTSESLYDIVGLEGNAGYPGWYRVNLADLPSGYSDGDLIEVMVRGVGNYSGWIGINYTVVDTEESFTQIVNVVVYPPDNNPPTISNISSFAYFDSNLCLWIVNISANVTDDTGIDVVCVNITHPNGYIENVTMNKGMNIYFHQAKYGAEEYDGYCYYFIFAKDFSGNTNLSSTFSYWIPPSYNVNGDDKINVLDMIIIGQHWNEAAQPGWIRADAKIDGEINILDLIFVGQHWTG